jgi:hypothetical protein
MGSEICRSIKLISIFACCTISVGIAQTSSGLLKFRHTAQEKAALAKKIAGLYQSEMKAEMAGNCRQALVICGQLEGVGEPARYIDRIRYRVYTKEGADQEAFLALKSVVTDTRTSRSADAQDPELLTELGLLAEKLHKGEEAYAAFLRSAALAKRYFDKRLEPNLESDASYGEIRSIALYNAGMQLCFQLHGMEAVRRLRAAVQTEPGDWRLHYGLAYGLIMAGTRALEPELEKECRLVLKLVPAELEAFVRAYMRAGHMPFDTDLETLHWMDPQGHSHSKVVHRH